MTPAAWTGDARGDRRAGGLEAGGDRGVPWWRDAVVHHVYPRSFSDSDGDGIGVLAGITASATTPRTTAPSTRRPGSLADLGALVAAARDRGLRFVLDLVPNHTSDRHLRFVESRAARTGPRRDWYVWADPAPDGGPPNNWLSAFAAVGPAWTLDPTTGQYYLHSYTPQQPDLTGGARPVAPGPGSRRVRLPAHRGGGRRPGRSGCWSH